MADTAKEIVERRGRAKLNHDWDDELEVCFICLVPFKRGDMVLNDISGGRAHRSCYGDDREGFVKDLDTGEPLGRDEPLPKGYHYELP